MNVTLIGMSGVGKSYIGERLATHLEYTFIDIDRVLEERMGKSLQNILDTIGDQKFLEEEESEILKLGNIENTVISPGGSIVYSPNAVADLKKLSTVLYLEATADWIKERSNPTQRGIVYLKDRSFEELYLERQNLYKAMADYVVSVEGKDADGLIAEIVNLLDLK